MDKTDPAYPALLILEAWRDSLTGQLAAVNQQIAKLEPPRSGTVVNLHDAYAPQMPPPGVG